MNIYVQASAKIECREERGGKEFAWGAALPIDDWRKAVKELLDGGIAQGLDGELQALDALFRCGDDRCCVFVRKGECRR